MKREPHDLVPLPHARDPLPPIGIAVVGVGYFGSLHAQCYSNLDSCRLLALVDPDPSKQELAESLGVPWLSHLDDLPPEVRAVSVATPVNTHYAVAKTLIERGYDVLLEKPIAETAAEAAELRILAEASHCILQIGHIERFNPAFAVGPSLLSRAHTIRTVRTTRRAPGLNALDVVIDLMIHDLDLIQYGVVSPLVHFQASGCSHGLSPIDEAQVDLVFANGCRACLHAQWGLASRQEDRCMIVELDQDETWAIDFRQRTAYQMMPGTLHEPVMVCHGQQVQHDTLSLELASFLDASRRHAVPQVTPEEGHAALGLAEQIRLQILGSIQ
jgi:predicted dehydrogenase